MSETNYHIKADVALQELLEFLEDLEQKHDIYANLEQAVLSVTMPDEKEYVINKHAPSRQIWVSSPYSGAAYYELSNEDKWLPKRGNPAPTITLFEFLKEEISSKLVID